MASTVSGTGPVGVKTPARPKRDHEDPPQKARRLFAARDRWLPAHAQPYGQPCWIVPGSPLRKRVGGKMTSVPVSHLADLVECSCQRRKFLPSGPDGACAHNLAVRLWYAEVRRGAIDPPAAFTADDLNRFERQDETVANVADSLLIQHELRSRAPDPDWPVADGRPVWLGPDDRYYPDTDAPPDRDGADRDRGRRLSLVDADVEMEAP